MSTLELQNQLIRKILNISDQELLAYLYSIVGNEETIPYKLTLFEQQFIKESFEDYKAEKVLPNEEVFAKTDQWLRE